MKGAWPAVWMLGEGNGHEWPHHGEIDIVEAANGNPNIIMTVHSSNHNGGNGQHPPHQPIYMNSDFTKDPLICGFEWNVQDHKGIVFESCNDITYDVYNALFGFI